MIFKQNMLGLVYTTAPCHHLWHYIQSLKDLNKRHTYIHIQSIFKPKQNKNQTMTSVIVHSQVKEALWSVSK